MKRRFLGIDIGGTNLRGKIISGQGTLSEEKIRSDASAGISQAHGEPGRLHKRILQTEISAVGIGVPGTVDGENGTLVQGPNIADTRDFPFAQALLERIGDQYARIS